MKLFFCWKLGFLFKLCSNSRNYNLYRVYERGYNRLEKEMDIVKLVRGLRNLKIYNKVIGTVGS